MSIFNHSRYTTLYVCYEMKLKLVVIEPIINNTRANQTGEFVCYMA